MEPGDAFENEMQREKGKPELNQMHREKGKPELNQTHREKGKPELNQNTHHHEKYEKKAPKNPSDVAKLSTKKLKGMYEKSRLDQISPTYILIVVLAITIFWLRYQGWFEFWSIKKLFDPHGTDKNHGVMDFDGTGAL
ncbi:18328_t:CDS:1 [Acaulospora morrowiae]|uniref:18328_t:CDS:1 n=1 Tax=Acaulospora morrowiae TaxID=94023 RepID=A0A9N9A7X0_9GLOM|nr:18328_t:CDS:1 [Acaulospora morrowiae]